jgi:hypothetical protein
MIWLLLGLRAAVEISWFHELSAGKSIIFSTSDSCALQALLVVVIVAGVVFVVGVVVVVSVLVAEGVDVVVVDVVVVVVVDGVDVVDADVVSEFDGATMSPSLLQLAKPIRIAGNKIKSAFFIRLSLINSKLYCIYAINWNNVSG